MRELLELGPLVVGRAHGYVDNNRLLNSGRHGVSSSRSSHGMSVRLRESIPRSWCRQSAENGALRSGRLAIAAPHGICGWRRDPGDRGAHPGHRRALVAADWRQLRQAPRTNLTAFSQIRWPWVLPAAFGGRAEPPDLSPLVAQRTVGSASRVGAPSRRSPRRVEERRPVSSRADMRALLGGPGRRPCGVEMPCR